MNVVTRFPPSPTGMMHIGTARTALFNWLFARRHGGKMLFRIEDTDRARHSEDAVTALIDAMRWLEMDWDGEIVSQYESRERHAEVACELLATGKAWKCYFTPDELDKIKEENGGFRIPRKAELEANYTPSQTDEYTIRIEAPTEGSVILQDKVQGDVALQKSELDDFVLLRSDGTPTYMLSVVVDDHDMGVTHVIRGDDHLNNTFRQNVIYDAMGWIQPIYAHVPLILGPDGKKMSKRHGAASVEEYRAMGYLPEAMRNYLLRLGWSHGDDEIISDAQAREWFDLEHIGKAAGRFDFDKLESINAHYMQECDDERLLEQTASFFEELGLSIDDTGRARLLAGMHELKTRSKTLKAMAADGAFYLRSLPLHYDEKAADIIKDSGDVLRALHDTFEGADAFGKDAVMTMCKDIAKDMADGKLGKIGMPLRAALTGTIASPSIFEVASILGKKETYARLSAALQYD